MSNAQADKAHTFRKLHKASEPFVIANAWDAGSARVLAGLGFRAIASSSGAMANTFGKLDGAVTRDEAIAHVRALAAAVDVPVSGDLEQGFGDDAKAAAATIEAAADAGLVGGSIEDATGRPEQPLYDFELAVERVAAAVEAARKLSFPFILTARTENFLRGNPDLDDTIKRLQSFERVGADVLFAPGLPSLEAVRTVCQSVSKPVNFMIGMPGCSFSIKQLAEVGVKRISVATSFYRAAMAGLVAAAREVQTEGTFTFVDRLPSSKEYQQFMR